MGTVLLDNEIQYVVTSNNTSKLNSKTAFGGRPSDVVIESLRQIGVFGTKFAEPSTTAPTDTTQIWIDISEVTEDNPVPATIRFYDTDLLSWEAVQFSDIFDGSSYVEPSNFLQRVEACGTIACAITTDIRARWAQGKLGNELLTRPESERRESAAKEELKARNREFLRLLLKYHRRRGIDHLKSRSSDDVEEPFDTAAAIMNAQRLVAQAQGTTAASTGAIWEAA